jgi:hypothetical protein
MLNDLTPTKFRPSARVPQRSHTFNLQNLPSNTNNNIQNLCSPQPQEPENLDGEGTPITTNMKGNLNTLLDKIGNKEANGISGKDLTSNSLYSSTTKPQINFETRSLNNFNRLNSLMNDMSNDGLSIKSNTSINSYDFSKINTAIPRHEKFNLTNYSGKITSNKDKENNYLGSNRFGDLQEEDRDEYRVNPKGNSRESKVYSGIRGGGRNNIFE